MRLETRKNQYQHTVVDCPFCPKWVYVRSVTKTSPDALRDLKRHITNEAKTEAMAHVLADCEPIETPHLDYYKAHTSVVPAVPKLNVKRQYDDDMTV